MAKKQTIQIDGKMIAEVPAIDHVHRICKEHGSPVRQTELYQPNTDVFEIRNVTIYLEQV